LSIVVLELSGLFMNSVNLENFILPWAIALIVIFPTLILVLGELIHHYQKQGKPLAVTLQIIRK